MAVWKVVLLLDLALALGVGGGYVWWGRQVDRLRRELVEARAAAAGPREFHAEGVVRAVLPEMGLVVITHEEIAGYMPAMTMGFRATSPKVYDAVEVGDAVRFTLGGVPPNLALTAIEKLGRR
jgi:Cu/Ag efflux protein CusF